MAKKKHILNKLTSKVFVCNLDKREDRLNKIKADFKTRNIVFERYPAIDGDKITGIEEDLERRYNRYAEALVRTFKGVLSKAKSEGLDSILFFEDDVCFDDDSYLQTELARIERLPDYDVFAIGCMHMIPKTKIPFGFDSKEKDSIREKGVKYHDELKKVGNLRKEYRHHEAEKEAKIKPLATKLANDKIKKKPAKTLSDTSKEIEKVEADYQVIFDDINSQAEAVVNNCKSLEQDIEALNKIVVSQGANASALHRLAVLNKLRGCHALIIKSSCFDEMISYIESNDSIVLEDVINNTVAKGKSYCFTKNLAFQSAGFSDIEQRELKNNEFHS